MSDMDNDPFFRQLDLVAGAKWPVSWDLKDFILRSTINGHPSSEEISSKVQAERQKMLPYLRELLDINESAGEEEILTALTAVRDGNSLLTMHGLRRIRDERKGTYVPLVNDGKW